MDYRALEWIPEQWRVHLRRGDLCIEAGARTSSAASASKAIAVCSLFAAGAAPMDGAQAAMVTFVPQPDIQSACLNNRQAATPWSTPSRSRSHKRFFRFGLLQ
jgi:hypothetical protein